MISTLRCESKLPVGSSAREQFRVRYDRARNGNTLLLTAGKLGRRVVFPLRQADLIQSLQCHFMTYFGRLSAVKQRKLYVFDRTRTRQQIKSLKTKPRY